MTASLPASDATPGAPFALALDIQELVLDGLDAVDPVALGAAVSQSLGRLLAQNGVPSLLAGDLVSGSGASVTGLVVDAPLNGSVERVGARVAQAIYRGWSR